jgi:citrate lyase subunit beta/citryl-CoA lyase
MDKMIRRSVLILPVNNRKFVEKAYLRGADGIMLDLEDSVPAAQKETARNMVKDSIPLVTRGGIDVIVRVNKDPSLLIPDLEASVYPGLGGIVLPKTESADDVHGLEAQLEKLEKLRGIEPGHVKISLLIESPRGVLNAQEIAGASARVESMSLGNEDYLLELGVEPSPDNMEVLFPLTWLVTVCKAEGICPRGLMGSIAGFRDLEGFERAATRARQLGCEGASCIHPDQVEVLNRVFSPPPEKIEYARRVVEAFEEGIKQGTASVNLDGKMVDVPVYARAKLIFERAAAIAKVEERKEKALARLKKSGE